VFSGSGEEQEEEVGSNVGRKRDGLGREPEPNGVYEE